MDNLVPVTRVNTQDGVFVHVISIRWAFVLHRGVLFSPLFGPPGPFTIVFNQPVPFLREHVFYMAFAAGRPTAIDLYLYEQVGTRRHDGPRWSGVLYDARRGKRYYMEVPE